MLSLEAAIEKIKQLPPEEQQEVFKFILLMITFSR